MKTFVRFALCVLVLMTAGLPVFAADASTTVDFTPAVQYLAMILSTLLTGIVTWALNKYFGIQINQANKDTLETALQNGIALAVSKAAPNGITSVNMKSAVVAQTADYVMAHAADAAKHFGLDADPTALAEKIEARLVQTSAAAPMSPATAAPVAAVPVTLNQS